MPIANLLIVALVVFLAIVIGGALLGALINFIQCLFFAAVAAIGVAVVYKLLAPQRLPPASQSTIDQLPSPGDADQVSSQIQKRIERLRGDDA